MLISRVATALMLAAGLPAERVGVMIDVGDYRLLVADACSGLQSIYTLMAIAVLVLFLRGTTCTGAMLLTVLAAIPIVCALNALRIFAIGVMAYEDGLWLADGPAHAAAGALMYIAAFFALLGFARLMEAAWR
jgi:exosortase